MATPDRSKQQVHSSQCSCGFELLFIKDGVVLKIPRGIAAQDFTEPFSASARVRKQVSVLAHTIGKPMR